MLDSSFSVCASFQFFAVIPDERLVTYRSDDFEFSTDRFWIS